MANETATATRTRKPSAADRLAELEAKLAATEAALAEAQAQAETAKKQTVASGYKGYADKEITPAVNRFVDWVVQEFPELYPSRDKVDVRLVFIANKAYSHFQKSAANRDANGKALGRKA
jgi:hypothetical protein